MEERLQSLEEQSRYRLEIAYLNEDVQREGALFLRFPFKPFTSSPVRIHD